MKKLPLKHPIKLGENTSITELNFRDYTTAADYLSFDKRGGVLQRIALIASVTGSDETLIMRLHGADYRAAEKIVDQMLLEDEKAAAEGEADPELTADQALLLKKPNE